MGTCHLSHSGAALSSAAALSTPQARGTHIAPGTQKQLKEKNEENGEKCLFHSNNKIIFMNANFTVSIVVRFSNRKKKNLGRKVELA